MSGAEGLWFLAGGSCYAAGASVALHEAMGRRSLAGLLRSLLFAGAVMIALAIAVRWLRVGHGPFLDMYEILMSNLFSLGLIFFQLNSSTNKKLRLGMISNDGCFQASV